MKALAPEHRRNIYSTAVRGNGFDKITSEKGAPQLQELGHEYLSTLVENMCVCSGCKPKKNVFPLKSVTSHCPVICKS